MADAKVRQGRQAAPKGEQGRQGRRRRPKAATKRQAAKGKARQARRRRDGVAPARSSPRRRIMSPRLKKHVRRGHRARSSSRSSATRTRSKCRAIEKIVLNMGVGEAVNDTKKVTAAAADLALIAGQKPVVTRARKAISTFKVRENMPIGAKVTLAQDAHVRIPRPSRDGRAAARARLPRPRPEVVRRARQLRAGRQGAHHFPRNRLRQGRKRSLGMDIVVCTTAKTDDEARALLRAFNFPFRQ